MDLIHNGLHVNAKTPSFEWWYFHFIDEQGYSFNLLIHSTDIFGGAMNNYISITMRTPSHDKLYYHRKLPVGAFADSKRKLSVDLSCFQILENDKHIRLMFDIDDFRAEGKIFKSREAHIQNNGLVFYNPKANTNNYWWVPVPLGSFRFDASLNGKSFPMKGMTYHDHNWGDALLENSVVSWIWMHLVFDEGFLLIYNILNTHNQESKLGLLEFQGKRYSLENYQILNDSWEKHLLSNVSISISLPELSLELTVAFEDVIRERHDYNFPGFNPIYRRSVARANLIIGGMKKAAHGMVEHLIIEKV